MCGHAEHGCRFRTHVRSSRACTCVNYRNGGIDDGFMQHAVSQRYGGDLSAAGLKGRSGDDDLPLREPLHERRAKYDAVRARQTAADDDDADGNVLPGGALRVLCGQCQNLFLGGNRPQHATRRPWRCRWAWSSANAAKAFSSNAVSAPTRALMVHRATSVLRLVPLLHNQMHAPSAGRDFPARNLHRMLRVFIKHLLIL